MGDGGVRVVHFYAKHYESVLTGEKVTIVRWNENVRLGASVVIFDR